MEVAQFNFKKFTEFPVLINMLIFNIPSEEMEEIVCSYISINIIQPIFSIFNPIKTNNNTDTHDSLLLGIEKSQAFSQVPRGNMMLLMLV